MSERTGHYAIFLVPANVGTLAEPRIETRKLCVFVEGAIGGGSGPVTTAELESMGILGCIFRKEYAPLVDDLLEVDFS